jgi:FHA domain
MSQNISPEPGLGRPGARADQGEDQVSAVVGQWRATYTPGDWVLLSGPTSTVLLEPPPPEREGMIEVLWQEVLSSSSMTDLAGRLAGYPFDSLPSFAAFFWTPEGMRSLVRGAVAVIDLATGRTVAEGEGIKTWSEVGLGEVDQVLVEVQSGDGTRQELPLVVGAVRASSVRLDASEAARVVSPQMPAAGFEPEPAYAEPEPAYVEQESGYADQEPAYAEPEPTPESEDDDDESGQDEPSDLGPGPSTELLLDPFADDKPAEEWRAEEWRAEAWSASAAGPPGPPEQPVGPGGVPPLADADLEYPMWEPESEPEPQSEPVPARALPPESGEEMENADTALMPPPVAPPAGTGVSQDSLIMAVVCQYGHASAQNATACRLCGSPIAPQGPQLLPRPVLAVLRASNGSTTDVDRAVLVGRAPSAQRSTARAPRLMTVPSPGHDISRTHLEVAPEGWSIVVTDLHSTNGTTLVGPGGVDRQPLPAGEAVPVELGSVVELGDGISVLIDFPQ